MDGPANNTRNAGNRGNSNNRSNVNNNQENGENQANHGNGNTNNRNDGNSQNQNGNGQNGNGNNNNNNTNANNNNNTNSQNDNTENNDNNTDSGVPVNAKGYINFRLREDIDLHFMAHEQIGNGTFGRIHRIRYQGQDMALKIVYQDPDYGWGLLRLFGHFLQKIKFLLGP